ncbi:hypothetical protein D910_09950 [Dendroctonus ponderosae]
MFSLYRLFVVILSMLVIFSMFNQGGAQPIEDLAPKHAGPKQVGSEHLGPSRNQHAGPAGGPPIGSVKPEDIVLY